MANKLYNKQVTPKNYMGGGRVKKADGGKPESKYITRKPKKRKTGPYITRKNTTDKETVGDSQKRGKIDLGKLINRNRKMGGGMMNKRPMYKDGSLKPVSAENKGLSKLPTKVRNKMGFMKKGGKVK